MNYANWNIEEMNKKFRAFYRDRLGSPKFVMAPMVLQSELCFRMMCRKYNCSLAYSPMIRASQIIHHHKEHGNLNKLLLTHKYDRPLIVQICGNDPAEMVAAAQIIEALNICDAIDVNLGCPQRCAQKEQFGAYLLDKPKVVRSIIESLVEGVSIPITAKIRILPTLQETISFIDLLIDSGICMLAIHGRRRERVHHKGAANLEWIRLIKAHYAEKNVKIPIISNGNIATSQNAEDCLKSTQCEAVMSAYGLLRNPYVFDFKRASYFAFASNGISKSYEYLRYAEKFGVVDTKSINDHILEFCSEYLGEQRTFGVRKLLRQSEKIYTLTQQIACVEALELRLEMKAKATRTKFERMKPFHCMLSQIKKHKVTNYRLERKRSQKCKEIGSYSERINALFDAVDSDSG